MAELQLFGMPQSTFTWTARIALAEKGAKYTHVPLPPHRPEVSAIHPFGKIPVLCDNDFSLYETRAICGYIDRVCPGPSLMPSDPRLAAKTEQWVSLIATTLDPVMIRNYVLAYVFPGTPDGKPDRSRIDANLPALRKQLELLEKSLVDGHLVGGQFTLADAYLFPIVYYLTKMPESGPIIAASPGISAFFAKNSARPSVRQSAPPPMPAG